jgi:hypothetical protein
MVEFAYHLPYFSVINDLKTVKIDLKWLTHTKVAGRFIELNVGHPMEL